MRFAHAVAGALLGVLATSLVTALPAHAAGDAEKGKKVFNKCKACHDVGPEAKTKVGPILNDLFGRTAGTHPDYLDKYSPALKAKGAEGLVWTSETVGAYLADPKGYIPGNKMGFAGLKKPEEVADVLAYLLTFDADGEPAK